MKISVEGFNSKSKPAEGRVSKYKDRSIEIIQKIKKIEEK